MTKNNVSTNGFGITGYSHAKESIPHTVYNNYLKVDKTPKYKS